MGRSAEQPRFIGFDPGGADLHAEAVVSFDAQGRMTVHSVKSWASPPVLDLSRKDYKDITEDRRADDPSGGK